MTFHLAGNLTNLNLVQENRAKKDTKENQIKYTYIAFIYSMISNTSELNTKKHKIETDKL